MKSRMLVNPDNIQDFQNKGLTVAFFLAGDKKQESHSMSGSYFLWIHEGLAGLKTLID